MFLYHSGSIFGFSSLVVLMMGDVHIRNVRALLYLPYCVWFVSTCNAGYYEYAIVLLQTVSDVVGQSSMLFWL